MAGEQVRKLDKANIEDIIALTPMQEGLLFHYLKDPESEQYFEQLCLQVSGPIDIELFKTTWDVIVETNEMLRTVYRWEKVKEPIQIILKHHTPEIVIHDLTSTPPSMQKKQEEEIKINDRKRRFDLQKVPFRVTLGKLGEARHVLIISNHHILYDGWSTGIILREFFTIYNELSNGIPLRKPEKTKFKEFVKWLQKQDKNRQEEYWKEYLRDFEAKSTFTVKTGNENGNSKIVNYHVNFPIDFTNTLRVLAQKHQTTIATLLYAAWGILLQKYTNCDDILFGTPVSGRGVNVNGIEDMVGLFLNTLPLRITTNGNLSISELIDEIDKAKQTRQEYESTSLIDIKKYSEIGSEQNVFDSIVTIENYPLDKKIARGNNVLSVQSYSMFEQTNFDLTLAVTAFDNIGVTLRYNTKFFSDDAIKRMAEHLKKLLREFVSTPEKKIKDIEIISDSEREELLYTFNATDADYAKNRTTNELFEDQVERTPTNIAVVYGDNQLTYQELNEKSNQLAQVLRRKGIKPDTVVSLMVQPSLDMIIGIIGIIKAGGAFLPIDPNIPHERIAYMLENSQTSILVTQKRLSADVKFQGEIITIEDPEVCHAETTNLECLNDPNHLVYVIYTSGSTGKPKGVMVTHQNIINYTNWFVNAINITENDKAIITASFAFDAVYTQIFASLLSGGELHVVSRETYFDAKTLLNYLKEHQITYIKNTPSLFSTVVNHPEFSAETCKSIRFIMLGGEALNLEDAEKAHKILPYIQIMNHYGPTETTIGSIAQFINFDEIEEYRKNLTIGKPIDNTRVYILDKNLKLQPVGVPGELCIAGDGVGKGYLNKPELTSKKFIPDPFKKGEMLYRTGDLARWLSNGHIEFLGRMDHQVKVRGFRIELGEVENQLVKHQDIKEALAITRESRRGEKYLCAYYTVKPGKEPLAVSQLREFLSKQLPEYMLPSYFIYLDKIPLTQHNKVDRTLLPEPTNGMHIGIEYIPPTNEVEHVLVEYWKELLEVEKPGINDDFFHIGGNSLLLIKLYSRINNHYPNMIKVQDLFDYRTVKELAGVIIERNTPTITQEKRLRMVEF